MKKILLMPLIIILIGGSILASCEGTESTTTSTSVPTSTTTPAPTVIKLVHTDHNPATSYGTIHATDVWFDRIEAKSNGRLEVERYYGETLAKGTDAWMAVKSGVADTAWCAMGYWPGQTPITDFAQLPFVPFKSAQQSSGIFWKLYEKFPEMQQEYADVHPLLLFTAGKYQLLTVKKQVKKMDDLKGLNIRALGGPQTDALKALGANPMLVPMPDVYTDLQKGVLDGIAATLGMLEIFNLHEVTDYLTHVTIAMAPMTIVMSKEKWNSLPPDLQQIITNESGYEGCRFYGREYSDALDIAGINEAAEYAAKTGHQLAEYTLATDELARWQDIGAKPIWDAWVANLNAKGLPGKAILDELLKLVESEPE